MQINNSFASVAISNSVAIVSISNCAVNFAADKETCTVVFTWKKCSGGFFLFFFPFFFFVFRMQACGILGGG